MNLIHALTKRETFIENININVLKDILSRQSTDVTILNTQPKAIILSDMRIIKCFARYYRDKDGHIIKEGACHQCKGQAGITGSQNNCIDCHLQCLEKLKQGELYPNIK